MLSKIENGVAEPSLDLLERLCNRLGVAVSVVVSKPKITPDAQNVLDAMMDIIVTKEFMDAIAFGRNALRLKEIKSDASAMTQCLRLIGLAYHDSRNYSDAKVYFERAIEESRTCDFELQVACINGLASSLMGLFRYEEALSVLTEIYVLSDTLLKQPRTKIHILYNLSKLNRKLGNLVQAKWFAKEGLSISRRSGVYDSAGHLETILGLIFLDEGHNMMAIQSFVLALRFYEFTGDIEGQIGSHLNVAEAYIVSHRFDDALLSCHAALGLCNSHQEVSLYLLSQLEDTSAKCMPSLERSSEIKL